MARNQNLFVIDSQFDPFSFEELVKPYMAYKDVWEQTDEAYTDLASKADKFAYLADTLPQNSKARQIYEGYANDLRAQADSFSRGLTMGNRRALSSLKRRYEGEIGRLVEADDRKRKLVDMQTESSAKNGNLMYSLDAANTSLDYFIDNPYASYSIVNGDDAYEKGAKIAAAISSRHAGVKAGVDNMGGNAKALSNLAAQYIAVTQYAGYDSKAAQDIIANMSKYPEFQQARDSIFQSLGADKLSVADQKRTDSFIVQGFMTGLTYKEAVDFKNNGEYMTKAQRVEASQNQQRIDISKSELALKKQELAANREAARRSANRQDRQLDIQLASAGYVRDSKVPGGLRRLSEDELKSAGYSDEQIKEMRGTANINSTPGNNIKGNGNKNKNTASNTITPSEYPYKDLASKFTDKMTGAINGSDTIWKVNNSDFRSGLNYNGYKMAAYLAQKLPQSVSNPKFYPDQNYMTYFEKGQTMAQAIPFANLPAKGKALIVSNGNVMEVERNDRRVTRAINNGSSSSDVTAINNALKKNKDYNNSSAYHYDRYTVGNTTVLIPKDDFRNTGTSTSSPSNKSNYADDYNV